MTLKDQVIETLEVFFVYMIFGYILWMFTGRDIGVDDDNKPNTTETTNENTLHS